MLRKTQQRQTKKLTVIGDGKGNCANAQPGFSGDGVVFSEARTKGSSGSYFEDGCFCYSSYWVGKSACYQYLPLLIKKLYPGSDSAIIVVVSPLKALIKDQASCIVVFLSNLFYSAPNVTGISTLQ